MKFLFLEILNKGNFAQDKENALVKQMNGTDFQ